MSLIVSQNFEGQLFFVGDTRLYNSLVKTNYGYKNGAIKTIVIRGDLCISFAGSITGLGNVMAECVSLKYDECLNLLENVHIKSKWKGDYQTDFLLGAIVGKDRYLFEIKNGKATQVQCGWIGHKDAYECYMKYRLGGLKEPDAPMGTFKLKIQPMADGSPKCNEIYNQMQMAMKAVINDSSQEVVGDFLVPVCIHKGLLDYTHYVDVVSHPIDFRKLPNESIIPWGTASQGGFTVEFLTSTPPGAVGFFLQQGNFGIVYSKNAQGLFEPIPITDVSSEDFALKASKISGLEIKTTMPNPKFYIEKAEKLANDKQYLEAISAISKALSSMEKSREPMRRYVLKRRAIYYAELNLLNEALNDINGALLIAEEAAFFDVKGVICARLGDLEESHISFSRAHQLDPGEPSYKKKMTIIKDQLSNIS